MKENASGRLKVTRRLWHTLYISWINRAAKSRGIKVIGNARKLVNPKLSISSNA